MAVAGDDFTLGEGTLEFLPGERYRHFWLPIIDDRQREADETVVIQLIRVDGAMLGAGVTYTYTIEDNDAPAAR
jgi:hypothetical protein